MTSTAPTRARTRSAALLALLWVCWVVLPPALFLASLAQLPLFSSTPPTVDQEAAADRYLVAAVLVAIALPLAGLLLSSWAGRRVNAVASAVALTLALVVAVPALASVQEDEWNPDAPVRHGCQEHSGGDTRCPGG